MIRLTGLLLVTLLSCCSSNAQPMPTPPERVPEKPAVELIKPTIKPSDTPAAVVSKYAMVTKKARGLMEITPPLPSEKLTKILELDRMVQRNIAVITTNTGRSVSPEAMKAAKSAVADLSEYLNQLAY
jgi:hypothetical protein